MSSIQSSSYVADVQTRYASGLQRFIRHNSVPDAGPAITWDHPETLCNVCAACKSAAQIVGWEKLMGVYAAEAPMPGEPEGKFAEQDRIVVPGVSSAG